MVGTIAMAIAVSDYSKPIHWKSELQKVRYSSPHCTVLVQLGSEIRTSLDFEWLKSGWVANGQDFKWDLKARQMAILSKTILNPKKMFRF